MELVQYMDMENYVGINNESLFEQLFNKSSLETLEFMIKDGFQNLKVCKSSCEKFDDS